MYYIYYNINLNQFYLLDPYRLNNNTINNTINNNTINIANFIYVSLLMSIKTLQLTDYKQDFTVSPTDKLQYGEIYSPFSLIKNMLDLFDPIVFTQKDAKWLDTGAGTGYFSMVLFDYLNTGLSNFILDEAERKTHIIENMLYLSELKTENVEILKARFGSKANIIAGDFLASNTESDIACNTFDYIIGNPPYNAHGMKKVPTNSKLKKKQDGQTVWGLFLKKALTLLKPVTGQLCYIVPSLWMKPDKAGLYDLLTQYKIEKLHCLTNTETNKLFKGEAQTPTCYFLLTNTYISEASLSEASLSKANLRQINFYDKTNKVYINYPYQHGAPLPLFGQAIIQKLQPFLLKAGGFLKVIKTNMPSKTSKFADNYDITLFPYPNIKTCQLNGLQPQLVVNYSNVIQPYYKEPKLVLAHKMYGFPYLDHEGTYGLSNRDNYVILKPLTQLKQLQAFLSTKFALYVYEATRYRMKYLEKYAFELLPDITNLLDFPPTDQINDNTVNQYFGFSVEEAQHIQDFHKNKKYKWFL
jgi:tRNA1(Val) A37 N6-methylase TrmN6